MKVFVAGATGVIGMRLVQMLLAAGHEVSGHARTEGAAQPLRELGAGVALADVYDAEMLRAAVGMGQPEVVIDQLTAHGRGTKGMSGLERAAANNRIRTEGTRNLVEAAEAVGAHRVIAQSLAFAYAPGEGPADEDAPLFLDAPAPWGATVAAVADLERQVLGSGDGVVLRYGHLYGPGTAFDPDGGDMAERARAGKLPLVGDGAGVFSFTHVDDAASSALAALEGAGGTYNAVDDEPLRASDWLPAFASALGAPAPEQIDEAEGLERLGWTWTERLTNGRGASNARARKRLDWQPSHRRFDGAGK